MPRPLTRARLAALAAVTLILVVTGTASAAGAAPHWTYEGEEGPEHWAELDEAYKLCADASRQSPIDLGHATGAHLPSLGYRFAKGDAVVSNNGHTVMAAANAADPAQTNPADTIVIDHRRYALLQMHFHVKSEHVVDGRHHPAEAHFVYRSKSGAIGVVGVFLDRGERTNPAWQPFVDALATPQGATRTVSLDWNAMLPRKRTTVRYRGSLTTPPCSEGVEWAVETTAVRVSQGQLRALAAAYDHNDRPVQPVGKRRVLTDDWALADH
ncbi:MAG TPA: carbonic anhydrase family protein [Kineosporiaceae bacterium]|nr:carbonic anhydrase family protein [Kineosporiaceae bacterium]